MYVTANSSYFYEKNIKKAKKIRFDQLNGDGNYRKFVMMSGRFYFSDGSGRVGVPETWVLSAQEKWYIGQVEHGFASFFGKYLTYLMIFLTCFIKK